MTGLQESRELFKSVINLIQSDLGNKLLFPKRVFWLGGAPGAGKGVNTVYISRLLNIDAKAIVTSDLLQSPEAKAIKDAGGLVGDKEVMELLFRELLKEEYHNGVIIDGFPRTSGQVEALKAFEEVMDSWAKEDESYPQACLEIILLYVSESESVRRQLMRGKQICERNKLAEKNGQPLEELRATDTEPEAAKKRYQVFKETTFDTLNGLQDVFKFYGIDASGSLDEVRINIEKSFS